MIIDRLERAEKYYKLNPYFKKAFEFVNSNDLTTFEVGKYDIETDNTFVIIAEDNVESIVPKVLETHCNYIDIQIALVNSFPIKWKAVEDCVLIIEAYNEDNDVTLYTDLEDFEFLLKPQNFAILFPEDAHFAQAPNSYLKKAIIKVRVA